MKKLNKMLSLIAVIIWSLLSVMASAQTKKPDTIKVATSDVEALQRMIPQPCWFLYKIGKSNIPKTAAGFIRDNRDLDMKLLPIPTTWIILLRSPRQEGKL